MDLYILLILHDNEDEIISVINYLRIVFDYIKNDYIDAITTSLH